MSAEPNRAMSSPSKYTLPSVGSTRRSTVRPSVVLPQPDSPTRPRVSPRRTKKLTSSTALTQATVRCRRPPFTGKYLTRRSTSSSVSCLDLSLGAQSGAVAVADDELPPEGTEPSAPGSVGVGDPRSPGEWSDCVLVWSLISNCSSSGYFGF